MEFVGKIVRKEFKQLGAFQGVVESYDSSTGFFRILYENGDSEELDFSEVSCLISGVVNDVENVGRRKPKRTRLFYSGNRKLSDNNDVLAVDFDNNDNCDDDNDDMIDVNYVNFVNVNVNGKLDCGGGSEDGFDLNRGLNINEGVENGEIRGCIDLNLSVNDDGFDEDGTRVEKDETFRGNERWFDLNLEVNEESVSGEVALSGSIGCVSLVEEVKYGDASFVNGDVAVSGSNGCVGLVEEVKNGDNSGKDASFVNGEVAVLSSNGCVGVVEEVKNGDGSGEDASFVNGEVAVSSSNGCVGLIEEVKNGDGSGADYSFVNGEVAVSGSNGCVGLVEEVKNGDDCGGDVSFVNSMVCDVRVEEDGSRRVDVNSCEDANNSGRRKRRKVGRNLSSPTETVLRRSARRAKANELQESTVLSAKVEEEVHDLPVSAVIDELEEKPVSEVLETFVEPQVFPADIVFPPSSANINLEGIPVLDIFSVYSCLRSFSTLLYLSPFELEDFVAALKNRVSNQLIDSIHVSILQTLRKHLGLLASEGCESSSTCLRNLNWDLLDVITWPMFMVEYLLIHGSGLKLGFTLDALKLFDGEYYTQPAEVKIELLRYLCDDVVEVEAVRSELTKRTSVVEANMDKRRFSIDALGDSCLSEDVKEEVADGNSDECRLCKMDGNLICCDGCPAAYHSKCAGIVNSLLPEGDWYCPECVVSRKNSNNKTRKYFRGAELLGIDREGHSFFSCFNYLLVSDSYDAEGLCSYYHKDDLGAVIQLLKSSTVLYGSILSAISEHWDFMTDLCQHKENLLTSSEESGEVLQENGLIQKPCRPTSNLATRGTSVRHGPTSKQRKKKGSSARKDKSSSNAKVEDIVQRLPGDDYMNSYSFARSAASVVEELLRKPSGKANVEAPKTEEEIIAIQSKFILKKGAKSCWPTIPDLNGERQKEKCGWCYCCRFPVEGRGCLFTVKNTSSIPVALKAEIDGVVSKRNKKGHLVDVMCYILCMEERLRGFLSGPWLRPQYSALWRQRVLKASDVLSLKLPLLTVESNLRSLAFSADWWKHVDSVTTMGSASHFVASSRATTKNGISRKKVRNSDSETKSSAAGSGLVLFWWRGGKTSRSLFNWKVIPRSVALKAARKAGCMKIPDIQYPDASESARRTKCVAWRAAVKTSKNLEQLALQVRELDLFIRWDDIENTHPQSLLDKESIKSIRLFKKVIVRRKSLEGTGAKYLLDFGKRRSIPDVVLKHGKKLEESSCERKKFWLDEVYVPLYLLKSFEERRIARKGGKKTSSKPWRVGKVAKKPLREKGFDYLFSRAERADCYQCGHCNKNVSISEAVSCQLCNGYFHKRHVMKSSEGITTRCTYTCHRCHAGKHVKKERNLRKRKFGELREAKNLKVVSEGYSAKLRVRPQKKGNLLANRRQVLSRNAKKMQNLEQTTLSRKSTNVPTGITLRRSARKAKCVIPLPTRVAGGEEKKTRKPRNVASEKTSKGNLWKKQRSVIHRSIWVNGLLLSGKPNDERVVQFKRRKLLISSDVSADIDVQLTCSFCSHPRSASGLMFLACELCGDWFHGNAFGLNKGNIESLAGFRCHVCLEKSPPVCPFVDISRDNSICRSEATSEAQDAPKLPEVVANGKETDCVDDGPSDLLEVQTSQKSDENLDEDETLVLDTKSRIEVGSPDSPTRNILNRDEGSTSEAEDAQGVPDVLAVLNETYCDEDSSGFLRLQTAHNCDGNRGLDEIPTLDNASRLENGLPSSKELQCNKTSTIKALEAQKVLEVVAVRKETDCILKPLCNIGTSGLLESHSAPSSDGNLDHVHIPVLYSELRVENASPCNEELQCNEDSTSEAQELPEVIAVRKDTNRVQELHGNEGSCGILEIHTAQVCDENLDQDETPKQDFEFRLDNGSLTRKERWCDEGPSLLQAHTAQNSVGKFDQDITTKLDLELRLENGSIGSQDVDMEATSTKESMGISWKETS